jgi:hypothetical protein
MYRSTNDRAILAEPEVWFRIVHVAVDCTNGAPVTMSDDVRRPAGLLRLHLPVWLGVPRALLPEHRHILDGECLGAQGEKVGVLKTRTFSAGW